MTIKKNENTQEHREYWSFIEKTAKQADDLPKWMGGTKLELCDTVPPVQKSKRLG